ncbi:hypothetical protein FHK17_02155 [Salmonella enterica]|nr:hypothetical protein [Salmonella enterica]
MAGTNPLDTLKIKKLIGFKQITPGVIKGDVKTALNRCGIDALTSVYTSSSEFSIGSMSVLGNTFYGLKITTKAQTFSGYVSMDLIDVASKLEEHPIQVGFRLTQSATTDNKTNIDMVIFRNANDFNLDQKITPQTEDNSTYYEIVFSANKKDNVVYAQVYVNKQLITSAKSTGYKAYPVSIQIGNNLNPDPGTSFSYMIGDMYIAELDPNSDGTVTPQLLGNLTLEPFTVATYSGDKHTNTLGNDIVTAINTLDLNNDMGALSIKPVMQAATFTFNPPDTTNGSIMGASINVVYKDSAAPNNRLRYRISEGTQNLPVEVLAERQADVTGYTTFTRIMTTPEGGGAWNADNTHFALKLFNSETPEEE